MTQDESRKTANQLTEELRKATLEFNEIQRQISKIVCDSPSGLPIPDGQERIVQAGRGAQLAFESYQRAVKRYRDFVIYGILPPPPPEGE